MNTDPHVIRAQVDAVLADLPPIGTPGNDAAASDGADVGDEIGADGEADIETINAVGRRLEEAHQILVDALESVEKG